MEYTPARDARWVEIRARDTRHSVFDVFFRSVYKFSLTTPFLFLRISFSSFVYIYTVFANIFLREVFSILFFSFHSFWRGRRGEEILKDWDLSVERERVSKMSIVRRCGQEVNGAWMWMYDATKATEKLSTEHSSTLYTRKSRDHSSLVLDVALLLVDEKSCQGLFLYRESFSWNNTRHYSFSFPFLSFTILFIQDHRYSSSSRVYDIYKLIYISWFTSLFKLI